MMTAMVPAGRGDDYYAAALEPFTTLPFYETPAWQRVGLCEAERIKERLNIPLDQFAFGRLMWAYEFILEEWVGVEADLQFGPRHDGTRRGGGAGQTLFVGHRSSVRVGEARS